MSTLFTFLGRFHPLLVHLPIGFLLLALVLQWLRRKEKYFAIVPAIKAAYLLGAASAAASCISGWLLAAGGEYDEATLDLHRWMGISVALVAAIGYYFSGKPGRLGKNIVSVLLFVLILVTGHLGGTLTHGEGFLTKGIGSKDSVQTTRKPIANVQEAMVFNEVIQPIFTEKCSSCHSAKKQKGGLRLDSKDWILKGGKDGKVYHAGNATASELYQRVILDPLEEKHMPPKGKPQLTEQEQILLHWWLNGDAGFNKKVKEIAQDEKVKMALTALQSVAVPAAKPMLPATPVAKAADKVLEELRKAGITLVPVAVDNNYLSASFVSIPKPDKKTVDLLSKLSDQLAWLTLNGAVLTDSSWKQLAVCTHLTRLNIAHSNISDTSIENLLSLQQLQYLNLVGTKVTAAGVASLRKLGKLESLYLGETAIQPADRMALQKQFPRVMIDSGNYRLEKLATDTQLLKAPPVKK